VGVSAALTKVKWIFYFKNANHRNPDNLLENRKLKHIGLTIN